MEESNYYVAIRCWHQLQVDKLLFLLVFCFGLLEGDKEMLGTFFFLVNKKDM